MPNVVKVQFTVEGMSPNVEDATVAAITAVRERLGDPGGTKYDLVVDLGNVGTKVNALGALTATVTATKKAPNT